MASRLGCITKLCLLSWDLPIILWVTFRTHSLLFFTGKSYAKSFSKFEELVFCDLWFPDSGFWILVSDFGFRFGSLLSGFRVLGLPILKHIFVKLFLAIDYKFLNVTKNYSITDLVPREIVDQWLKYLRNEFPTIAFKASTQSQKQNLVSELIIIVILSTYCFFPFSLLSLQLLQ